jgi:Tol biopolymer transport system component
VGVFSVFGNHALSDIAPAVQLTNDPEDDRGPKWSPVANKIAWTRNYTQHGTIWTMETDGTHLGTNLLKITTDGGSWGDWGQEWRKPDGAQIYFITERNAFWDIMRVPSTGGLETWLYRVPGGGGAGDLSSSPDGSQFAFYYIPPSFNPFELRIANADFTNIRTILELSNPSGDGEYPIEGCSWSPDGTKIAIGLREAHSVCHIALINTDGTGLTSITSGEVRDIAPRYSPDGTKIAFYSCQNGNWDVWVVNADGTNRTRITDNPADDIGPTWSPDGTKIAFQSNRSGNYDTWAVDVSMLGSLPKIVSISPNGGPTRGGTPVTIKGENFAPGATVTIGGNNATNVKVVDAQTITAKTPPGAADSADVTVTNPDDYSDTLEDGFIYVELPPLGDVSGDWKVSAYDAALILQYVVGLIDEFPCETMQIAQNAVPASYAVSIPDKAVKAGGTIFVPIQIDNASVIAGALTLRYDRTILRAKRVLSDTLSNSYWQSNIVDDRIRVAFARIDRMEPVNADLFLVEFDVLPEQVRDSKQSNESIIHFDNVKLAGSLSITLRDGRITIIPDKSLLLQNYPNPFNPETWIPYQLAEDADVSIDVYSVSGKLVKTLHLGQKGAGFYMTKEKSAYWDGRNEFSERVASGVYFYQLRTGGFAALRRMVVVK